jgi:hypothetical protein
LGGHLELCRFLLTQPGLSNAGIAEPALNEAASRPRDASLELYRLFIESSDFDPDLYEIMSDPESLADSDVPMWLKWCRLKSSIQLIQSNQISPFFAWPFEKRLELSMHLFRHPLVIWSSETILAWVGLEQATRELALYKDPKGDTALHMVAWDIGSNSRWEERGNDDVQVAVDLISLGADVSAVRSGRTPFMDLIDACGAGCCQHHLESSLRKAIHTWTDILRRSGVDVRSCARTEQSAWASSVSIVLDSDGKRYEVRRFIFDEDTEEWGLEMLSSVSVPLYEAHSIPGAWVPHIPQISRLCWPPSDAERNDCGWIKTGGLSLQSAPWIVSRADRRQLEDDHESLLMESQDDHRIIALRVGQRKPSAILRRRGSISHSLGSRAFDRLCPESKVGKLRPWLPDWHICPYDGRLRFDCESGYWGEPSLKKCMQGISIRESCVQETENWLDHHFDGWDLEWWRPRWSKERPPGSEPSSFLTDDGRWVSTQTWKTIKVCGEDRGGVSWYENV